MLPQIPRPYVQFISMLLFGTGAITLIMGDASIPEVRAAGIVLCAFSIWFVMMSESVLLSKVQTKMQITLEKFNRHREKEIARHMQKIEMISRNANPLHSIESA